MQSFRDPWYAATALIALLFVLFFTGEAIRIHDILGTSAYDLGIADQNIWLLSRFEAPFNTIRGLHTHGDHFRPIEAMFVPFYWLKPGVNWLFLFQSISVGAGALFLYRIGQQLGIASGGLLFLVGVAFLGNPAVHNPLLWQYHSAVLASGLYFAWILSYLRGNLVLFILILILLLTVREDMCFTTAAFGGVLLLLRQWRYATWTIGLSVAWFLVVFFWLLPVFNGEGYFRIEKGSTGGIFKKLKDLDYLLKRSSDEDVMRYWMQLFSPVAFLPIAAPLSVAPALPSIIINSVVGVYNTRIDYHYNFNAIPFIYFAALVVLAKLGRMRKWLPLLGVGAVVIFTAFAAWDASKTRRFDPIKQWRQWNRYSEVRESLDRLRREIGPDAGVSASDFLVPVFAHRKAIYLFPNPWRAHYWGISGENQHSPNKVDALILSHSAASDHYALIYHLVAQGYFEKMQENNHFSVFRRLRPEPTDSDFARRASEPHNLKDWPYRFTDVRIGPVVETSPEQFDQLHIAPTDGPPEDWRPVAGDDKPVMEIDAVELLGSKNFSTVYLYAQVSIDRNMPANLILGSDDGISVWHNGQQVWTNLSRRSAKLGDDEVALQLRAGVNHFYFRLNNATSTWKLMAFVTPMSFDADLEP